MCSCRSAAPGPMAFSFILLSLQCSEEFNCLHAASLAVSFFSFDLLSALGRKISQHKVNCNNLCLKCTEHIKLAETAKCYL